MKQLQEIEQLINTSESDLQSEFEQLKKKVVIPTTKTIRIQFKSCCGCGCSTSWYEATVPFDHPWDDGHKIDDSKKSNEVEMLSKMNFRSIKKPKDL